MTETVEPTDRPRRGKSSGPLQQPRLRLGAVVAVAVAVGFVIWLVVGRGGSSSNNSSVPSSAKAVPISFNGLKTLGGALNRPIYWAGAKSGLQYELSQASDGRVWIRYLPQGTKIGEQDKPYLTIGTYPVSNAYAVTNAVAKRNGSVRIDAGNNAVAFYSTNRPTNVYLAYRGTDWQVEVYDPSATTAQGLVSSKQVRLIPGSNSSVASQSFTGATRATPATLKNLASTLKHPVYWLGTQPNVTYELTQTSSGNVFIRYLPPSAKVGERQTPYLTVATYPLTGALAATKRAAKAAGTVSIKVGGGGFAFYNTSDPTSVHLAYPGQDYQVEVYDPSALRAHQLVSAGQVRPIP